MGTDELDERIELLYQSGFCDEAGRDGLRRAVDALVRECGVKRDDEVLGMLVTHVAAALKRVREGEAITPLSPESVEEVRSSPAYAEAKRIHDNAEADAEDIVDRANAERIKIEDVAAYIAEKVAF